jgi:hypothetical protein
MAIPDGNLVGIFDRLVIGDEGFVTGMDIRLDINHAWAGDLIVRLTNEGTGRTITLLDRPQFPELEFGCDGRDVSIVIDDGAAVSCESRCNTSPPALSGSCRPSGTLSAFYGEPLAGTWALRVIDAATDDTGTLVGWCLEASSGPPPTPGGPVAPVVTSFTCNGSAQCFVDFGESFALEFSFTDANGDAEQWHITAERHDGMIFEIDQGPIVPPSGSGTMTRYHPGVGCGGVHCPTTLFDLRVVISDATSRESVPGRLDLTVLGQ